MSTVSIRYDVFIIYLLIAVGLSPGGSTHLQTNNTKNNTNNNRTTQITTNVEECGSCFVFASFTLAFALQLRKKYGKTSVSQGKKNLSLVKKNLSQSSAFILPKHPNIIKPSQTHTLQNTHTHTQTYTHMHTLQNNIKPPQHKLKQNA
jgi:hypothetical protein